MQENQNPFGNTSLARRDDPGAMVEVEQQRAIAETQAAMIIAKRFRRNQIEATDRIMSACTRLALAESALYQYARGGTDITGPSIRLAEALAQNWGNLQFGIRELEQRNGESTVEAFAWDMETNTKQVKVFQVGHKRYTKQGMKTLVDPRDIYEMVANQGARRLRACILGIIPGDVVESAVKQCETTMNTKAEVTPERIASLVEKFAEYKVTKAQIEARIQRRVDAITPALLVNLGKIYNSLKDGMSAPADWFEHGPAENDLTEKLKANATVNADIATTGLSIPTLTTESAVPGEQPTAKAETKKAEATDGADNKTDQGPQPKIYNPYTNPIQQKYGADKSAVIMAECEKRDILVKGLLPREAHALLIDSAKAGQEAPEEDQTAYEVEEPVTEQAAAYKKMLDEKEAKREALYGDNKQGDDLDENAPQKIAGDPAPIGKADLRDSYIAILENAGKIDRGAWMKSKQQVGLLSSPNVHTMPIEKLIEWATLAQSMTEGEKNIQF